LEDEMHKRIKKSKGYRTIAFSHIPPFINDSSEDDGYFNLSKPTRRQLLTTLRKGGCTHWFCGHYHRNAGGIDRGEGVDVDKSSGKLPASKSPADQEAPLEVVISSAVGCVLIDNGEDPLGLKGFKLPPVLSEETSGIRIVDVDASCVEHHWFTLEQLDQGLHVKATVAATSSESDEKRKKKSKK
jgi:hypothetical protein